MEQTKLTGYPSIDKPWLKYYTKEDLAIKVPACTVYQNIYDRNKDHPNDVAILYYGNKIRYKALFSNVELCAKALRQIGIHSGDCVTLCTAGVPEAIYLVLACSRIGAIANFLNPLFTKEQMIERINETEAKWIFVLDAMYSYIEAALPETCIENVVVIPATNSIPPLLSKALYWKSPTRKILRKGNERQHHLSWKDFCSFSCAYEGAPDVPYQPDTPTVMVYSSGSTGASKGIVLTNDGINATIRHYISPDFPYQRGYTFLQMIPVWFSTGIVLSMLMPLCIGITVILEPVFSKESFAADLKKFNPNMTLTAASLWVYVLHACTAKRFRITNMIYPATGGELVLPRVEKALNAFFRDHGSQAPLLTAYGMCELGSTITTDSNTYHKIGASGYPMTGVIVAAFDLATDKEMRYGQRGELRVCSPARMKEYYKNQNATDAFFKTDSEGRVWGCTGDIGYIDEDGFVYVLGRAKDHFHRENGEIVYLFDIEGEILKDEAVDQCKVVYFKTSSSTVTVAHIVFRKDVSDTDAALERIHRRLIRTLPDYMIPQYYKARAAMPVHTNGKLDVYALRDDREGLVSGEQLK